MGLPTIAMGTRGWSARQQARSFARSPRPRPYRWDWQRTGSAEPGVRPQVAAYQARLGPIDPRKQVFVAATDTLYAQSTSPSVRSPATTGSTWWSATTRLRIGRRATRGGRGVRRSAGPADRYRVRRNQSACHEHDVSVGPDVVNRSAPDGNQNLLFANEKVPLTPLEKDLIGLDEGPRSGPAAEANAGGPEIAGFKVGLATSYPAFAYGYPFGERPMGFGAVRGRRPCRSRPARMPRASPCRSRRTRILDAGRPRLLTGTGNLLEWMSSVWRSVADPTVGFAYNVTPMMNGNLLDLVFDGQTSITGRGFSGRPQMFVGNDRLGAADLRGPGRVCRSKQEFLAMTPWSGGSGKRPARLEREATALALRECARANTRRLRCSPTWYRKRSACRDVSGFGVGCPVEIQWAGYPVVRRLPDGGCRYGLAAVRGAR